MLAVMTDAKNYTEASSHFFHIRTKKIACVFPWGVWPSSDGGGGELTWAQFSKPTWV